MQKEVEMINGINSAGSGRLDTLRTDVGQREPVAKGDAVQAKSTEAAGGPSNPAAALASQGAPIDTAKIDRIRAAIAEGRYPVDPQAIAEKMIALDLPRR